MVTKISDFDKPSQKILKRWFTIRSLSSSTQEPYLSYFTDFIKFSKKPLIDIYEKAKEEERKGIPENDRELTWLIIDYKNYIDEQDYAQNTKNLKMNILFSFCRSFDFPIPKFRMKKALCEEKNYERPLKKEEILEMLNVSPLRERAFINIQASSGMGQKEVRSLTIKNILDCINNELDTNFKRANDLVENYDQIIAHEIYEIVLIRSKASYRYVTYLNNQSMGDIIKYIGWRCKQTNKKRLGNDKNELLFVTNEGKPMSQKAVTAMYREVGNRCGFETDQYQYRYWRSHNVRKYFYNIVESVVGEEYAHEWLGHKADSVTRAYARRQYRMRTAYERCLPFLKLETETNEKLEKRLRELEKEIAQLKKI